MGSNTWPLVPSDVMRNHIAAMCLSFPSPLHELIMPKLVFKASLET